MEKRIFEYLLGKDKLNNFSNKIAHFICFLFLMKLVSRSIKDN